MSNFLNGGVSVLNGTPLSPPPFSNPLANSKHLTSDDRGNSGWLAGVRKSCERRGGERGRNVEKWKVENGGGGKREGETWRAKVDMLAKLWGWECGGLMKANERSVSSGYVEVVHQSSV